MLTVQFSCCLGMAPGFPVFSFWEHSGTEPVTVLSAEMSIPSDQELYRIHGAFYFITNRELRVKILVSIFQEKECYFVLRKRPAVQYCNVQPNAAVS